MTLIERIRKLLDDGSEEALREVADLLWAAETGRGEAFEPPEAPIGRAAVDWEALRRRAMAEIESEAQQEPDYPEEEKTASIPPLPPLTNGKLRPLFLGYDAAGRGIRLKPKERQTHTHVIGSSGSGKSKFLEWMMRGQLRNREGFCLIDPHGTLYHDVLKYCAHHVLERKIILLDLSNSHPVVGFNPFKRIADGDVSVQVDNRITATLHAWGMAHADQTPTLERVLRIVYTAMIEASLTLPEARHLIDFENRSVRKHLLRGIDSPLVRQEWEEIQGYDRKEWRDEFLSAKNRLFRFLSSKTLCRFMGVPDNNLDLKKIMNEGKILLVNLAASDRWSKENARVFGSLLINEFFETAIRRGRNGSGGKPKPYHLYLDEFQNFVSLDIANTLDEARKFGLFLVLAHQRFKQLDENVLEAAMSNCRIKAVFGGLTAESARTMAEELFIGKLDPRRVKAAIYQTKFWPKYRRDKVYSRSSSQGSASGSSQSSGSGSSTTNRPFGPGEWFVTSTSEFSGSTQSESKFSSETEGEADIPIFFPVPFEELSSVQYYSLEEQRTELTAALKEQYPRHCFIKIHEQDTQPMLVPFVPDFYTSRENFEWYEERLLRESGALPVSDVERLIAAREQRLLESAERNKPAAVPPRGKKKSGSRTRGKRGQKGKTLFDEIIRENDSGEE